VGALARGAIRRWLREPLLHFALIGALLFFVYGRMNPGAAEGERIVVTQAIVDDLARQHQARWMRPATEQELANLVEAHIRDEILFREGVALGLDSDDPVIKRRVRQKFELMSEEQMAGAAPSDTELSDYMAQNAARFTRPVRVSFEQIFFDGSATVAEVERAAAAAKVALARGADPARLGQPTMLPRSAEAAPLDMVARDFGSALAEQLPKLPQGVWVGPVASGLGAHLVRVTAVQPAALPPLDDVRQQVAREWENARRERSRTESYRKLRGSYDVVIEADLPQVTPRP
jgi:hypothetical protein